MGESSHRHMERNLKKKIVIIGAGNVATHLAIALSKVSDIIQIYSRSLSSAEKLCNQIKTATATNQLTAIIPNADIYIISIKDDAIIDVVNNININNGLWVHTSGSVPMDVFEKKMTSFGVLYPLQTFTRDVDVNMNEVPFFIEGNNHDTFNSIKELALMLSPKVYEADSFSRCTLHTAAVFACNFTNFMWSQADEILQQKNLAFDIFEPLIRATLDKALKISPKEGQTGPARRGDKNIINKHIETLNQEQAELYSYLSNKISKQYNS